MDNSEQLAADEKLGTKKKEKLAADEEYVLSQYNNKIKYYWEQGGYNKRSYKRYRSWTIFLGATVTLISSISAAEFIQEVGWLKITFAVLTPAIAVALTVMNGLGQNFHWGAAWRDMALSATRLEKERDRFKACVAGKSELEKELDILNTIVLEETTHFFERVLDNEAKPDEKDEASG